MTPIILSWAAIISIVLIACLGSLLLIHMLVKIEEKSFRGVDEPTKTIVGIAVVFLPAILYWYIFWFRLLPLLMIHLTLF